MTQATSRFWSKVRKDRDCWEWTAERNPKGYGLYLIGGKTRRAHRIAWRESNGDIPEGLCVLHRCDNPSCVRPSHLFLGTHADNVSDKVTKGRQKGAEGERNRAAKLTKQQVEEIRKIGESETQKTLANRYNVCRQTISMILLRVTWKNV